MSVLILITFNMATINEKGQIVIDLKCHCGKVCGNLIFGRTDLVNEEEILKTHTVECDDHKKKPPVL